MILVVAPYNGALPERTQYLAGSKKIREIIKALNLLSTRVILLNSGHQNRENCGSLIHQVDFDGVELTNVISPPTRRDAYIGRVLNIINAEQIIGEVIESFGVPDVAWFYNGHAFEMRCASFLRKNYGTQTILEFEDWHFARNRGFNPKPYIDWLFWRMALKYLDAGFAVNTMLRDELEKSGVPTKLLPGIITQPISEIARNAPPFRSARLTVGYFGGLSEEKGAGALLRLAKIASKDIFFVVTGTGPLHSDFERLAGAMPGRVEFRGSVPEDQLVAAMSLADVIVNAHQVNDGIFPFKVLEALASGRLLISTQLPMEGYHWFSDAIQFYDGNEVSLLNIVRNARTIYKDKMPYIAAAAKMATEKYGQSGLVENIRETLVQFRRDPGQTSTCL